MTKARKYWFEHSIRQARIEKYFVPKFAKVLRKQIIEVVRWLDQYGYEQTVENLDVVLSFNQTGDLIKELYTKSSLIEANAVLKSLNGGRRSLTLKRRGGSQILGLSFDEIAPIIEQYFKIRLLNDSAIPITEHTKSLISRYLVRKVEGGMSYEDAIIGFKSLAVTWTGREGLAYKRAKRIARTESTKSMGFGAMIGAYMSGVDCDKIWVTSADERVRGEITHAKFPHTHLDMNKASIFGSFYNGEAIRYPGDPDASVENIANCRCAMFFEEKKKPKPRVSRLITNFLVDFLSGFLTGINLFDSIQSLKSVQNEDNRT